MNPDELLIKPLSKMTQTDINALFAARAKEKYAASQPFTNKIAEIESQLSSSLNKHNEKYFKAHCYAVGTANTAEVHHVDNQTASGGPEFTQGVEITGTVQDKKKALQYFQECKKTKEVSYEIDKLKYAEVVAALRNNVRDYQKNFPTLETLQKKAATMEANQPLILTKNIDLQNPHVVESRQDLELYKQVQASNTLMETLSPDFNNPEPYKSCIEEYLKQHKGDAGNVIKKDKTYGSEYHKVAEKFLSYCPEIVGKWLKNTFSIFKSEGQKTLDTADEALQKAGFDPKP